MAITPAQLQTILRRRVARAGSLRKFAREIGVAHALVSVSLQRPEPWPAVVAALGYRRTATRYEKVDIGY